MTVNCTPCGRTFTSNEALRQHEQDSPAHAFVCTTCNRRFGSDTALQQHLQNASVHLLPSNCDDCGRSFESRGALEQHVRDSPACTHISSFDCGACNRSFGSEEALQQHLKYSRVHTVSLGTPLDEFFISFATFRYDPSLPPATSYNSLQKHEGWRQGDAASKEAWNRYQDALEGELRLWYGTEDDLTAWHALCRAIGVRPLPQTCEQCERCARRTHVNIIDLIEWGRKRNESLEGVQTFRTVKELRIYTRETRKIIRNTFGKEDEDSNVVLRHLLRKIYTRIL